MSTPKKPSSHYLLYAHDLARLFPSLKKYRRRKTLTSHEKAAIARKIRIFEIVGDPDVSPTRIESRPEKYQKYTYPARRKRSIKSYVAAAKRMERIIPEFRKYRGRRKLTPAEKGIIRRYEKRTRHTAELEPVSVEFEKAVNRVARRISGSKKARVTFPIPKARAIKLKNIETLDSKNVVRIRRRATNYGMSVDVKFESGYRRFYKFVYTGADFDALVEAAEQLFAEGAITVYYWINHGRSSAGFRDIELFRASIGDDEMREGMSAQAVAQIDTDISVKLLQAKNARGEYEQGKLSLEDLQTIENQMVWIYGVIGLFQFKK